MQGTPSCLTCPPPASRVSSTLHFTHWPKHPQTSTMTHIANCLRAAADGEAVYISQETSFRTNVSDSDYYSLNGSPTATLVLTQRSPGCQGHQLAIHTLGEKPFANTSYAACNFKISALARVTESSRRNKTQFIFRQACCPSRWPFFHFA
jgi:hypothetical protein